MNKAIHYSIIYIIIKWPRLSVMNVYVTSPGKKLLSIKVFAEVKGDMVGIAEDDSYKY